MRTPSWAAGEGARPHVSRNYDDPPHPTPLPASGEREQTESYGTLVRQFQPDRLLARAFRHERAGLRDLRSAPDRHSP